MMSEAIAEINESVVTDYFVRLDQLVKPGTELYVIGGSAIALLGAKIRTTADVDVALPYSKLDLADFTTASAKAGLYSFTALGEYCTGMVVMSAPFTRMS